MKRYKDLNVKYHHTQQGQTILEYILVVSIIASVFGLLQNMFSALNLNQKITKNWFQQYSAAYHYGHPKATGPNDPQGANNHPRWNKDGTNNFRLFQKPTK